MSGTTRLRGLTVLMALAVTACATPPTPPEPASLLDSISRPRATLGSCAALDMALVCESSTLGRARSSAGDRICQCADRRELTMSGTRR